MRKLLAGFVICFLVLTAAVVVWASFYMADYALAPQPDRADTASCFREQFRSYPETKPWVDSLRRVQALRDTFVVMPTGERHHAYYIWRGSPKTALVLHGWRGCGIDMLFIGRIYERLLGYNVVLPDFHAHGLSEGRAISMGWPDRRDMLRWMEIFRTDTMAVHGISMGGATAMMMAGEKMPAGVRDVRFVDDCGYTSVWDELSVQLRAEFGLPEFPLMFTTSLLCKWRYGWSFGQSSAIRQVARSPFPMLFIHGGIDRFVPTEMARRLYEAKPSKKELWIAPHAAHALSYQLHKEEYVSRLKHFLSSSL